MESTSKILKKFISVFNTESSGFDVLKGGVSDKIIVRIFSKKNNVIGVYNSNIKENTAFIGFTNIFNNIKLNVPKILYVSDNRKIYFVSDLGVKTLFDCLKDFNDRNKLLTVYKNVINHLIKFQILGKIHLDFNLCYETKTFDKEQIELDVNKFKTFFLRRFLLENGKVLNNKIIEQILDLTINVSDNYFMYRDFQPRNIIYNNDDLYFVDYQSGRLGPPQYDLISFLYSGSIDITPEERSIIADYYYEEFNKSVYIDREKFLESLDYFALLRIIQVLGSYCFSYYDKNNTSVINKIPTAINNLKALKLNNDLNKFRKIILEKYSTRTSMHL